MNKDIPLNEPSKSEHRSLHSTVCPFCALVCDDLSPLPHNTGDSPAIGTTCARAQTAFQIARNNCERQPLLQGHPVTWDQALRQAADLLSKAQRPLFDGLLGDLQDARAAWRLAAQFGGVIDHRDGATIACNQRVFQDTGWQTASLGEVRNRADLVIRIGAFAQPRLEEKLFEVDQRLHRQHAPHIVDLDADALAEIEQTRILRRGGPLAEPLQQATALHQQLAEAKFAVFLVGQSDAAQAELILRSVVALVREINESQRAALLTLGAGMGAETAQLCGSWHSGFGIRTDFSRGYPRQDLHAFSSDRLLRSGEADLRIWISSLDEQPPSSSEQTCIVLGHPAMQFEQVPELYLPISVPGVHRDGFIHRGDGLHLASLKQRQASELPSSLMLAERLIEATADRSKAC